MLRKVTINLIPFFILISHQCFSQTASSTVVKKGPKYDTIIRKHVDKPPAPKPTPKPSVKQATPQEVVLPMPEFENQPCYYDKDSNRLVKLETGTAQLVTKKKTLGLKGAKEFFSLNDVSSKVRFTSKSSIVFFVKTGDVNDLTSYIKLYKFIAEDQKRVVTINSKEGMLNDKEEEKGKQINFSVKANPNGSYAIQFAEPLEAGEYGFVWIKNMDMKEFTVYAFGIDWKSSN
ncbi:MAG TPA: hypothetical protein VGG71_14905 [Chitinophagaceae bacterium]